MSGEVDTTLRFAPAPRTRTPGDALRGAALADPLSDPLSKPVQANGGAVAGPFAPPAIQSVATAGVGGSGEPLPHASTIQGSFGHHDIGDVRAHTGPEARGAAASLGTTAYATGSDVALGSTDLRTVAHEAAHTVQQARGVQLNGGVGAAGDVYERQADAAADAVVAGRSAQGILDQGGGGGSKKGVQGLFGLGGSSAVAPAPASGAAAPPLPGGAPPVAAPAPSITPGGKADAVTVAGDATTVLQGGGALGVKAAATFGSGLGEAAMEGIGVASEILGWAGVGLGIFGIAENLVRGRDARIRLGAFTRAYQALPQNDPIKPYLQDAAKQQTWENRRRWVRVAVSTVIVGLSMAALIVGTGGIAGVVMAAVAGVLAIAKGIETIRNFFAKRAARKRQEEIARELLTEALGPTATEERRAPVVEMLNGLSIPVPQRIRDGSNETPEFTRAVTKLAPHLSRAEDSQKVSMQDQASEFFDRVMLEADAAIAAAGPAGPERPQVL